MRKPSEQKASTYCSSPDWSSSDSSGRGADSSPSELVYVPNTQQGDGRQQPRKRRRQGSDASSTATTPPPAAEPRLIPPSPTHDTSHVPDHISSIQNVAKWIQAAASEAWKHRFRYNQVFVLLLNWEDDDLNVEPEVVSLEATFRCVYNYKTEMWKIPTTKPDWHIKKRLIHFLEANDADGNLVIFYYAGHAMPNPRSGGAPLWSSRRTHGKTMFSGGILSTIEESESDFLLLFDCCNAYHPPSRPSGSGRNVIEVISAVGFGAIAAEPGTDSFTHHLDEALALAKRYGPIKAVRLHTEIISRLFANPPRRLRRGSLFVVDDNGPVEEKSRRMCPLHYWLSGQSKSITLAPLDPPSPTAEEPLRRTAPPSAVPTPDDLKTDGVIQIQQAKFPQVLVSFRVTREDLEPATWVKWLREAPPEARDLIKIEGFWGSFSSLMLVRMPVHVWDLLPASPAASFVGFTTSNNDGPRFQNEVDNLLSAASEKPRVSEKVGGASQWRYPNGTPVTYRARRTLPFRTSNFRRPEMDNEPPVIISSKKAIKIGDSDQLWGFYSQRFRNIQQVACKLMAKIWIHFLMPKGVAFPLGILARDIGAPDWWPKPWGPTEKDKVRYTATDHLLKKERVHLLAHILRLIIEPRASQHPDIQMLSLDIAKLEEHTMQALSGFFNDVANVNLVKKKVYLKEIFKVARWEEMYKGGEIDANTEIYVMADGIIPEDDEADFGLGTAWERSRDKGVSTPPSLISPSDTTWSLDAPSTWANTSIPDIGPQSDTLDWQPLRPGSSSSSVSTGLQRGGSGSFGILGQPGEPIELFVKPGGERTFHTLAGGGLDYINKRLKEHREQSSERKL